MSDELKPCPFCGGKASEWSTPFEIEDIRGLTFSVGCKNKECLVRPVSMTECIMNSRRGLAYPDDRRDESRHKWNKRWNPAQVDTDWIEEFYKDET